MAYYPSKLSKVIINSVKYIKFLSEKIVPIIKLNYPDNWYLQQDNSPVHTSQKGQNFIKISQFLY